MFVQSTAMKTNTTLHQEILTNLKKHSGKGTKHTGNVAYLGNDHFSYHISNPIKRTIIKEFVSRHKDISLQEFTDLLDVLFESSSHDEKSIAGMLLGYYKKHRATLNPKLLDAWLPHLKGWAEIDCLCQSNFTAGELLADWKTWQSLLTKFSKDKDISKRRASLVLLTGPVSQSNDSKLFDLSIKNIETLKGEKDILITKAISWLLRSMVKHHKAAVGIYIEQNLSSLPKIAIRETQRKIKTGRK